MKKILAILIISLWSTHTFAIEEQDIVPVMQEKIQMVTKVLSEDKSNIDQKAKKIFDDLDGLFDISLMGRLSLGRYWGTLSKVQQETYAKEFKIYMKRSYIDKLKMYENQKITITGSDKVKANRIWLNTEIENEKETYKVIYKFYKSKTNGWLIYDMDIVGVSIIKSYQAQFQDTLANNSFEYFLDKLKN